MIWLWYIGLNIVLEKEVDKIVNIEIIDIVLHRINIF